MSEFVLVVHGGAGRLAARLLRDPYRGRYQRGLARALLTGRKVLARGGSALHAVTQAVAVLEDDEWFNAGRGAVLCADGTIELSASIMRGRDRAVGAVVGAKRTRNPVHAARAVMRLPHGLLFGTKADSYAQEQGLPMVPSPYFYTRTRKQQWHRAKASSRVTLDHDANAPQGTVGAVARDRRGHVAAATSTGGLVNQRPGRVGDTPVIGAGTWADDAVCAVSATGDGDAFARVVFARRVADLIELGRLSLDEAARSALRQVKAVSGAGGCIGIDANGAMAMPFTTPHMLRGWVCESGPAMVAFAPGEAIVCD